jgi:hypothetical protein
MYTKRKFQAQQSPLLTIMSHEGRKLDIEKSEIARGLRREAAKLLNSAKELESKAASLLQSAAILDGFDSQVQLPLEMPASERETQAGGVPRVKAPRGTRKAQVRGLLLLHGPLTRGEIMLKSGIPKGTLDHLLNEKNGFRPRPDGQWELLPETSTQTAEEALGID